MTTPDDKMDSASIAAGADHDGFPQYPAAMSSSASPYPQNSLGQPALDGFPYVLQPVYGDASRAVPNIYLASRKRRFGDFLLFLFLVTVTLGIGYMIWAAIRWSEATSPAKKILGMRVIHAESRQSVTWNQMFIRSVALPVALTFVPFGGFLDAILIYGEKHQRLTDVASKTIVVTV